MPKHRGVKPLLPFPENASAILITIRSSVALFTRVALLLYAPAFAVTAAPPESAPATLMTQLGRLLVSENFDGPLPLATGDLKTFASGFKGWRYNLGEKAGHWEVVSGAFHGAERVQSRHPATASYGIVFKNLVFSCEVRMEDRPLAGRAKHSISLRFTDADEYVSGVYLDEGGLKIRKEDHDHGGPDKLAIVSEVKTPLRVGQWQTLVVEITDEEIVATVNGRSIAGRHPSFAVEKHSVMFLSGGDSSVRHLRIWEARPNPAWAENRNTLSATAAMPSAPSPNSPRP